MKFFSVLFMTLMVLCAGCKKEKSSGDAEIKSVAVTGTNNSEITVDTAFIDQTSHVILFMLLQDVPAESYPLTLDVVFDLPAGAKTDPSVPEITFSDSNAYSSVDVIAENGERTTYTLYQRDTQIPDSHFEYWYNTTGLNGQSYKEPGISKINTVWATANSGTSIYGIYGTTPVIADGNTKAQIRTGETSSIPITSGTLFTGEFDVNGAINNPTDPKKATKFGIPFVLRPSALRFKYTYQPGERYIKGTLNNPSNIFGGFTITDLEGGDEFTAYAILEKRTDSGIIELGRLDFTSGELQETPLEITLPFIYTSTEKPTHITIVFASSKNGDQYTGAAGSTLVVDNVKLLYQ